MKLPPVYCSLCDAKERHLLSVGFTCTTCVCKLFEPHRIQLARVLTEREEVQASIERILGGPLWKIEEARGEIRRRKIDIQQIMANTEKFVSRNRQLQSRILSMQSRLQIRQANLSAGHEQLQRETLHTLETSSSQLLKLKTKIFNTVQETINSRQQLVHRAAEVYNFRMRRFTTKRDADYTIAKEYLPIPSAETLDSMNHHHLNAAMTHFCHFLLLLADYLAIKLPCEIEFPAVIPTIRPHGFIRKRPLHIPSSLQKFINEHTEKHILFIEAFAMLCYDVQFLCYTQGLTISNEEALEPGKCIYRLIISKESSDDNPFTFAHANHASQSGMLATGREAGVMEGWNQENLYAIYRLVKDIVLRDADWQVLGQSVEMERKWTRISSRRD